MVRLGIGSYTFGWATGAYSSEELARNRTLPYMTSTELIDRAGELGVEVVQICDKPSAHLMSDDEIDSLSQYAREHAVTLEVGTTGSDPAHLERYVRIASRLGARLVRTLFATSSTHLAEEKGDLSRIVPLLEELDITLAVENHERYACADLAELIRNLGSERVGVCLDTVNSLGRGEGLKEVVETLMPYSKCLHVKDFVAIRGRSNMGFEITGAITGSGRLDIPAHIAAYREVCPNGSVILEQWTAYTGDLRESIQIQNDWAQKGMDYLRTVVAT